MKDRSLSLLIFFLGGIPHLCCLYYQHSECSSQRVWQTLSNGTMKAVYNIVA